MGIMFLIIDFIGETDPKTWGVCNSMPNKVSIWRFVNLASTFFALARRFLRRTCSRKLMVVLSTVNASDLLRFNLLF